MRITKFRGKRIDTNEWVYGSLVEEEAPLQCFGPKRPSEYLICKSGFADWNMPRPMTGAKVFPDSIGEYIGLKDKNNKDIYEGDIGEVIGENGSIIRFIVKWGIHRREMSSGQVVDIPSFCFDVQGFSSFPIVENYKKMHDLDMIEIIGTTYDNPELLEK